MKNLDVHIVLRYGHFLYPSYKLSAKKIDSNKNIFVINEIDLEKQLNLAGIGGTLVDAMSLEFKYTTTDKSDISFNIKNLQSCYWNSKYRRFLLATCKHLISTDDISKLNYSNDQT